MHLTNIERQDSLHSREKDHDNVSKLERYRNVPTLGPRVLFFSGGTALRGACTELLRYTHNSIHIITPFDSGGSSAVLRRSFNMPAIGDVRNRLTALADTDIAGGSNIFTLLEHRFPVDADADALLAELNALAAGQHKLLCDVPAPMRLVISTHFQEFMERMPMDFDLRGANLGNIILAAGYLAHQRHFEPVLRLFSQLLHVRGRVYPVVNEDLHLAVRLVDGSVIVGQHKITGKEAAPIARRIDDIWTVRGLDDPVPVKATLHRKMRLLIGEAELICYPIGSFYTSVAANLLVNGVGTAVSVRKCPKVYVPNTLPDPESLGLSVADQVERLAALMRCDVESDIPLHHFVSSVLIDSANGLYPGGLERARLCELGVEIVDCSLVTCDGSHRVDPQKLVQALLRLI